jgi:surface antigen
MVIFRIIKNLILLPFRLLTVPLGIVTGILPKLIFLPITLVTRHLFLTILVVLGIIIYINFKDSGMPAQLQPAQAIPEAAQQASAPTGQQQQPVIEPVMKRENGDSAFSADLYRLMNEAERAYYSKIFYWAMSNVPDGDNAKWNNANSYGTFYPTQTFKNGAGHSCRRFKETLKVRTIEQQLSGIACPQAGGAWCKLKPNATPACGLGGKRSIWDGIKLPF